MDCELYTLNGIKPARVDTIINDTVHIKANDGSGTYRFSIQIFERKMNSDKLFYIC